MISLFKIKIIIKIKNNKKINRKKKIKAIYKKACINFKKTILNNNKMTNTKIILKK